MFELLLHPEYLPYWLNPLIVAGISALLALFITGVDALVNNYGRVIVTINKEKELEVAGGSPLLLTLSEQGIFIPSACGGRGTCGACKCKVTSDVGPYLPTETPFMTPSETKENIRLSCQIKVKQPTSIEIPEELFNVKEYDAVIESIVELTHDIKQVRFTLLNPDSISFKAGQYMQFEAPPYAKIRSATQRAYSISSNPEDPSMVELIIRLVPGGIVTTYVFEHLKEGEHVRLIGPFGDFQIQPTNADMICVAGGSGMAPIKSIIHYMLSTGQTERNLWYFFGARSLRDMFYIDELKAIEAKWPNFHFVPALSEPQEEDKWTGDTGLITDVLDQYLKEKIISPNGREGYLCGSPGMIDACVKVMNSNEMPAEKIFYDKFA